MEQEILSVADYYHKVYHLKEIVPREELARVQVDLRRDSLEQVIFLANSLGGPQIQTIPGKGYGLVAEKRYTDGVRVTFFGGEMTENDDTVSNDYVVQVQWHDGRTLHFNPEYVFQLGEKGRWANDEENKDRINCELVKGSRSKDPAIYLETIDNVRKGKEFLWYYGDAYDRTWKKRPRIGAIMCHGCRLQVGTNMCGYCDGALYCSQTCANTHWMREHYKCHK